MLLALGQCALLIAALALLPRWWPRFSARLTFPYPNDPLEGTLLHEARLLAAGEPLYRPLTPDAFVSAPYPPLHSAAVALADRMAASSSIFLSGRLVSALAALTIAILIVVIVWTLTRSVLGGALGAALFLGAPPVLVWATRIKPDLFAIALALGGLACALAALPRAPTDDRRPHSGWLVFAALLCALAVFARQSTLAATAAVGLGLWLRDIGAWRRGQRAGLGFGLPLGRGTVLFGLVFAALVAAGWAGLEWVTGGAYGAHVLGLHRSEWWSMLLVRRYLSHLWPLLPAIPLALLLAARVWSDSRAPLLLAYLLIAPFTILGAAEISANHNHVLEPVLAACLACGAAVGALWPTVTRWRAADAVTGLAILALAAAQVYLAYQPQPFFGSALRIKETPERFVTFMRSTPGEMLSDDVGLLLVAGKPVRYNDPSTMGPAAHSGVWDASQLIAEIRGGAFSAIVVSEDMARKPSDGVGRWTEPMREAIRARYRLLSRDTLYVYVPK